MVRLTARTSTRRLPGPRGNPVVGSALSLRRDLLRTLLRDMERFGDLVAYPVGPVGRLRRHFVVAHHPDDVQKVLTRTERTVSKDTIGFRAMADLLGRGLLTTEGEEWRRQRQEQRMALHQPQVERLGGRVLHERELHAELAVQPGEQPVGPAVEVAARHHVVAALEQAEHAIDGRQPAGERQPVAGALQVGHACLERSAGRVARARVLVALVPAHALLGERRRQRDRGDDRTGRRIGGLPGKSMVLQVKSAGGDQVRVLITVGRGKQQAYLTQVVLRDPACGDALVQSQLVVNSIEYTK